jgi:hypothetical protein
MQQINLCNTIKSEAVKFKSALKFTENKAKIYIDTYYKI